MDVWQRFRAWLSSEGWSQDTAAAELGISQGAVSKILRGGGVSRKTAHAIEQRSESWDEGPIKTEEWDAPIANAPTPSPAPAPPAKVRPRPAARARAAGGAR